LDPCFLFIKWLSAFLPGSQIPARRQTGILPVCPGSKGSRENQFTEWLKANREHYNTFQTRYSLYCKLNEKARLDSTDVLATPANLYQNRFNIPPFCEQEMAYVSRPWYSYYMLANIKNPKKWDAYASQFYNEIQIACPGSSYNETEFKKLFIDFQESRQEILNQKLEKPLRKEALKKAFQSFRNNVSKILSARDYLSWEQLRKQNFKAKEKIYKQWEQTKKS